jgi:hypothetical protein
VDVNEFTNMLYSDVQEDDGQVGLDMDSDWWNQRQFRLEI